jgi:plasmid stabilization system protein ParE
MAADSDYQKIAEHALAMLKVVYLREGPDAAVRYAKCMVEAAALVIANELGPAETRRFLYVVGVTQGQDH